MDGENIGGMATRNEQTLSHWMPYWIKNMMMNYQKILQLSKKMDKNLYMGTGSFQNISINSMPRYPMTPCLVCGSGPSLDDAVPFMKNFPGKIIAGSSNICRIASSGRDPDYVVVLDSNKHTPNQLKGRPNGWPNTTLLTHPSIEPDLLKYWKWNLHMFRPLQLQDPFFDKYYPMMYPFLEIALLNAGCTVNSQLELANFLGFSPVILCGVDFGYPDNRARHTRVVWEKERWGEKPDPPIQTKYALRIAKNGVATTEEMITYKQNLFLVGRTDLTQLYTSSRGIIRADETLGFINPNEYKDLGKGWPAYVEPDEVEKMYDKVLLGLGIKLVEANGVLTVTMDDKKGHLPKTQNSSASTGLRDIPIKKNVMPLKPFKFIGSIAAKKEKKILTS